MACVGSHDGHRQDQRQRSTVDDDRRQRMGIFYPTVIHTNHPLTTVMTRTVVSHDDGRRQRKGILYPYNNTNKSSIDDGHDDGITTAVVKDGYIISRHKYEQIIHRRRSQKMRAWLLQVEGDASNSYRWWDNGRDKAINGWLFDDETTLELHHKNDCAPLEWLEGSVGWIEMHNPMN